MTLRLLKLTLIICALTSFLEVKAQYVQRPHIPDATFYGQLVDSLTKDPLPAAVISVVTRDYDGNRMVRNFVSDEKGAFRFVCTYTPFHRMEVSTLGYKPYVRELSMDQQDQNLGKILLSQSNHKIDEVLVKARLHMYKMKGDTIIFMPRAVKTMKDDPALAILRQMPGVEVDATGGVKILGQQIERTYVNEKLLFGEDPKNALLELKANEVASIEAYDEVDEADAALSGKNARKRKVLNVVTFKEFTQSYSANLRGELGTDFHKDAEGDRALRYLGSGNVNFFSEALQVTASGGADNLTAKEDRLSNYLSRRQSHADAKVSGRSDDSRHRYSAGYNYNGDADRSSSASSTEYFPTDYFTSQHREQQTYCESESSDHSMSGSYNFAGARTTFNTIFDARLSTGDQLDQSFDRLSRDSKALSTNDISAKIRRDIRFFNWSADGGYRFKGGNSITASVSTRLSGGQSRGVRFERRETAGVTTPLAWESYTPIPDNSASGSVSYKFNFEKSGSLSLESGLNYAGSNVRQIYTDLQTGERDLVRSEEAFDKLITWSTGSNYLYINDKHTFSARLNYVLESRTYDNIKAERVDRRQYHFVDGDISYFYKRPQKDFDISLSSNHSPVQARQFSSRIIDTNPLYVSTGNSSLEPTKNYTLSSRSEFMTKNGSYGFSTQLTAHVDPVISRTRFFTQETILPELGNYKMAAGSTLTTPENGASYLWWSASANYKVRIAPLRLFLDMEVSYSLANPEEVRLGTRGRRIDQAIDLRTRITTNFSSKLRITINNSAGVGFIEGFGISSRDFRDILKGTIEWDVVNNLFFKADYTGIFNVSLAPIASPSANLLNLSLGIRVLKERGRISINAYDVLNDYAPIRVSQTLDAISQNINYIGANYFTISFDYKFNNRKATN